MAWDLLSPLPTGALFGGGGLPPLPPAGSLTTRPCCSPVGAWLVLSGWVLARFLGGGSLVGLGPCPGSGLTSGSWGPGPAGSAGLRLSALVLPCSRSLTVGAPWHGSVLFCLGAVTHTQTNLGYPWLLTGSCIIIYSCQ